MRRPVGTVDPEAVLRRIYGDATGLHRDLHDKSEAHRLEHGGACDVYPSDPGNAPLWPLLTAMVKARRFLEVGCGLGYTAALMAEAGGPRCHVDTIEADEGHAALAGAELARRGLADRVTVLRGRAEHVLPRLLAPFCVLSVDSDWATYPQLLPHLVRLTRPGGVLVSANLFPLFADWARELPHKDAVEAYLTHLVRDPRFVTYIIPGQWHALSYRSEARSLRSRGQTSASGRGKNPRSPP